MRQRIEALGGQMAIETDRRGTRLTVALPLERKSSFFAPPRVVSA